MTTAHDNAAKGQQVPPRVFIARCPRERPGANEKSRAWAYQPTPWVDWAPRLEHLGVAGRGSADPGLRPLSTVDHIWLWEDWWSLMKVKDVSLAVSWSSFWKTLSTSPKCLALFISASRGICRCWTARIDTRYVGLDQCGPHEEHKWKPCIAT
jgi:hypothetical protein